MDVVLPQSPIINFLIPRTSYNCNKIYCMSKYVVVLEYKQKFLLFNTLTREMIALEKHEYDDIHNNKVFEELIEKFFFIESEINEKKLSDQICTFAQTLNKTNEITHFTIFPTLDCNARCFYCFEHGSKRYSMSEKTAFDTADYIIKQSKGRRINILWFGGEPLFNKKVIEIITNHLNENNIDFTSKMITNGYLFDENTAMKAKNDWKLNKVQITLDGTREVYNQIKNYIYKPNNDAFDKVITNIQTALNNGIKVIIRINMNKDNCDNLRQLVKYLCKKFKGNEKQLSIYVWLLYDNRGAVKHIKSVQERSELNNSLFELEDYICNSGFGLKSIPPKDISTNMCGADAANNVTILPNGNIGKCDHFSDSKTIGSIYGDSFNQTTIDMWKERREQVELCDTCPIYPQCIKLKNCPELGAFDCDVSEQKRLITALHRQMRYAYDRKLKE